MSTECHHPPPPTECKYCGSPEVVVSVSNVGSCRDHIDNVFEEAAVPLNLLLAAAADAFGEKEEI